MLALEELGGQQCRGWAIETLTQILPLMSVELLTSKWVLNYDLNALPGFSGFT